MSHIYITKSWVLVFEFEKVKFHWKLSIERCLLKRKIWTQIWWFHHDWRFFNAWTSANLKIYISTICIENYGALFGASCLNSSINLKHTEIKYIQNTMWRSHTKRLWTKLISWNSVQGWSRVPEMIQVCDFYILKVIDDAGTPI